MAAKRCPRCKLVNPATAERCDCGMSFVDGTVGASLEDRLASGRRESPTDRRHSAAALMIAGAVLAVLGVVITVATYSTAESTGGRYFIAYGPMVVGAMTFVRGVMRLTRQ